MDVQKNCASYFVTASHCSLLTSVCPTCATCRGSYLHIFHGLVQPDRLIAGTYELPWPPTPTPEPGKDQKLLFSACEDHLPVTFPPILHATFSVSFLSNESATPAYKVIGAGAVDLPLVSNSSTSA